MRRVEFVQAAHREYVAVKLEFEANPTTFTKGLMEGANHAYTIAKRWNNSAPELLSFLSELIANRGRVWTNEKYQGNLAGMARIKAVLLDHMAQPPTVGRHGHVYPDWRSQ